MSTNAVYCSNLFSTGQKESSSYDVQIWELFCTSLRIGTIMDVAIIARRKCLAGMEGCVML